MVDKNIQIIDSNRKPISGAEYKIIQGTNILALGKTDGNERVIPISQPISSKIEIQVYLKVMGDKKFEFLGKFLWPNSWPLNIQLMAPGKYLIQTQKNKGGNGEYKRKYHIVKQGGEFGYYCKKLPNFCE